MTDLFTDQIEAEVPDSGPASVEVATTPSAHLETARPSALPDVERMYELTLTHGKDPAHLIDYMKEVLAMKAEHGISHALAQFKARCPEIPKFKKGGSFVAKGGSETTWYYAPLDTIARFIDPVLIPLGLSYRWDSKQVREDGTEKLEISCVVSHIDGGSRTSTMTLPITGTTKMSPAQKWGGTRTFGKRLTLCDVLGITTQDDIDGYDSPSDVESLDDEQVAGLAELVEEVLVDTPEHSAAERITMFLSFLGVDAINQVKKGQYEMAMKMLESKRRRA